MKRILSILLSLIFCLGIFVSCDTETQTESSSESDNESSKSENAPAKDLPFFSESIKEENYATYYKELSFDCKDNVLSLNGEREKFFLIDSYDELNKIVSNASLVSSEMFENYFMLAWKNADSWTYIDLQGFHDLKIEGSKASIKTDFTYYSDYRTGTSTGPYEVTRFILVPRSELEGANITELEFTSLPIVFKPSKIQSLDIASFDYKDGTAWLIRSNDEWEQFSKIHDISSASGVSTATIALIIYREKSDQNKTIAYAEPVLSADGSTMGISCYQITDGNEAQSTKCTLDIVYIEKDYFLSVGVVEGTKAQINFKNITVN